MASLDSVTVSIAADASGICSGSFRVNIVRVSTSVGRTDDLPGFSSTSSKVSPSVIEGLIMNCRLARYWRGEIPGLKQYSPAGIRRAAKQIHQIEKIALRPFHILETSAPPVKRYGRGSFLRGISVSSPFQTSLPR